MAEEEELGSKIKKNWENNEVVNDANYRVLMPDEKGELKDVTFSEKNPLPLEVLLSINVGRNIATYLAKTLEKDWVWNENYPEKIVRMIARLVGEALKAK